MPSILFIELFSWIPVDSSACQSLSQSKLTLNTLGPLFISNGSEPNRSVLPFKPLLPLLDTEVLRRGAAIFGGGATVDRSCKEMNSYWLITLNTFQMDLHRGGVMFSSLEKPLLLMLLLLLLLFRLLLLLFRLLLLLLLLLKKSCWPKLLDGSKPNRSLLMALRPLLRLSCISSARGSKSLSESEFKSSSSIFWLLLLPPPPLLLLLIWLDRLLRGGTIGKNELGDDECVEEAVIELVSISSLSSSGQNDWKV